MYSGFMDYSNSILKKAIGDDKVDPGSFSFMQPAWWALHATALAGVYMLGSKLKNRY